MTPIFQGTVNPEGQLQLKEPYAFKGHLRSLAGKPIEVVVRVKRNRRSLEANAFYWGVVVPLLGEEFGYDKQDMHDVLAMHFLRIENCPVTGAPRRKHTPDCDTKEFSEYVDACIRLGAEHGVIFPAPDGATP
jgi:hypothetical protein